MKVNVSLKEAKSMKKKLPFIILISGLIISLCAAYYSVFGLSKLFSGEKIAITIMASSLELSKVIIATLLYQYWKKLNKLLKTYLISALSVLILITSLGIYGFLSSAYDKVSQENNKLEIKLNYYNTKLDNFNKLKDTYTSQQLEINTSISELRKGLSNNKIQYKDKKGNIITTTSSADRNSIERQLQSAIENQNKLNDNIISISDSISQYEVIKLDEISSSKVAAELGPLKYISKLTNMETDRIVNYFILLIIFVFDPLAITLLITANFAFSQNKNKQIVKKDEEKFGNMEYIPYINTNINEEISDEKTVDDILNEISEDYKIEDLSKEQIRNMSSQKLKSYLDGKGI